MLAAVQLAVLQSEPLSILIREVLARATTLFLGLSSTFTQSEPAGLTKKLMVPSELNSSVRVLGTTGGEEPQGAVQ